VIGGKLPRVAAYTWRLHWPSALLVGGGMGVISLAPFVFKRSLGADERWIPALIAIWQAPWILTPLVTGWLARVHPQRVWYGIALAASIPLICVAFVDVEAVVGGKPGAGVGTAWLFVLLFSLYHLTSVFYIPHRGALMRTNYPVEVRGRFFGIREILSTVALIVVARTAQHFLDSDPRSLRVLFPFAGVCLALAYSLKARIRWRGQGRDRSPVERRGKLRDALANKPFLTYELGFMLYGFGFLMSFPLLVLFMEDELQLNYNEYTLATSVAMPVTQILAMFFWGRLADRIGTIRMTSIAFFLLVCFLILVPFVSGLASLILAFVLFGAAMSGVFIGWSIGPLHFAPEGHGHLYVAVHFSAVGIRSVIAPFLGYAVKEALDSYRAGFWSAAVFMLAGAITIARLSRRVD
jgi:MFS family permease